MNRKIDRIPVVISEIERFWLDHAELRLGQLLFFIGAAKTGSGNVLFYMEDDEIVRKIRQIEAELEKDGREEPYRHSVA